VVPYTFEKKIPTAIFAHKIGRVDSNLCHVLYDSFEHFLVFCPQKKNIWTEILILHFPLHLIQLRQLSYFLLNLQYPENLPPSQHMLFYSVISTTLWCIWKSYWQYVVNNIPFHQETVSTLNQSSK
jgi:hypothetical protein